MARKDRAIDLDSFLAKTISSETSSRSKLSALQMEHVSVRAESSTTRSYTASSTEELNAFLAENGRLISQVADLTFTVDE